MVLHGVARAGNLATKILNRGLRSDHLVGLGASRPLPVAAFRFRKPWLAPNGRREKELPAFNRASYTTIIHTPTACGHGFDAIKLGAAIAEAILYPAGSMRCSTPSLARFMLF